MPELPEVETVRRGLLPHLEGHVLARAEARRPDLRWPLPPDLVQVLTGARVTALRRRSKYILADLEERGTLLLHLGMSGRMLIEGQSQGEFHRDPAILPRHDHVVLWTDQGTRITFNDARRFGMVDLIAPGAAHPLLAHLGPEPLGPDFTPEVLARALAGRWTRPSPPADRRCATTARPAGSWAISSTASGSMTARARPARDPPAPGPFAGSCSRGGRAFTAPPVNVEAPEPPAGIFDQERSPRTRSPRGAGLRRAHLLMLAPSVTAKGSVSWLTRPSPSRSTIMSR